MLAPVCQRDGLTLFDAIRIRNRIAVSANLATQSWPREIAQPNRHGSVIEVEQSLLVELADRLATRGLPALAG